MAFPSAYWTELYWRVRLNRLKVIYEANKYYALTLTFPDTGYVDEIERIFAENGNHDLPSEPLWKIDGYTVRATSLIRPRRNTIKKGELYNASALDVRVKTSRCWRVCCARTAPYSFGV